jgi:hypothetical protein
MTLQFTVSVRWITVLPSKDTLVSASVTRSASSGEDSGVRISFREPGVYEFSLDSPEMALSRELITS